MKPKPTTVRRPRLGCSRSWSRAHKALRSGLWSRRLQLEPLEQRTLLSASISGTVFGDLDRDRVWEPGGTPAETGLEGWTVELHRGGTTSQFQELINSTSQQGDPPTAGDRLGYSLALVGNKLVVGAPFASEGVVHLYHWDEASSQWKWEGRINDPDPEFGAFGYCVAAYGDDILVSSESRGTGRGYLFDGSTYELRATFDNPSADGNNGFGYPIAAVGDKILVGAKYEDVNGLNAGRVYVFGASGAHVGTIHNPTPGEPWDNFGDSLAPVNGGVLIGAPGESTLGRGSGAAYFYGYDGQSWELRHTFLNGDFSPGTASDFGHSVGKAGDNFLIESKYAAYLYNGSTFELLHVFPATYAAYYFPDTPETAIYRAPANTVAAVGGNILAPSPGEDAVYLYDGSSYELLQTFRNPDGDGDWFGASLAVIDDKVFISCFGDDSQGLDAGAVYVFEALPQVSSMSTDISGGYTFTVDPGEYQVREVLLAGFGQTLPRASGAYLVEVAEGGAAVRNFGNVQNTPPTGVPDSYSMNEGEILTVGASGVLSNDFDAEPLSAVLVRGPSHGELTWNRDGSFTYIPDLGFARPGVPGVDTFTYKADDGAGYSEETSVTITVDANSGVYPRYATQPGPAVGIPNRKTVTSAITVPQAQSFTILDLDVRMDITHSWDSDLDVFLIGPDGTRVELFTDVGGSLDNFRGTWLDDDANLGIVEGAAPYDGTTDPSDGRYRPEGDLAAFYGRPAAGVWTLEIYDDASRFKQDNTGTLNSWSLVFTHAVTLPPQAGITVTPTSGLVTTEAGGTASFSVVLDTQPTATVTIPVSSNDTTEGTVSVPSLTFTAAN